MRLPRHAAPTRCHASLVREPRPTLPHTPPRHHPRHLTHPTPHPPHPPQNERAFQKQPTVSLGYKKLLTTKASALRWTRNVGLGFKTPKEATKVRVRAAPRVGGGVGGVRVRCGCTAQRIRRLRAA